MVTVLGTIFLISKGVFFFLVCGGVKGLFVVKPYTVVMVREGFLSCLFHKQCYYQRGVYAMIFWEL